MRWSVKSTDLFHRSVARGRGHPPDVYMRPLPPENKAVVEWVREQLAEAK